MYWRDIHSDAPGGAWLGLEVTIEDPGPGRPLLHMQAGRPGLMRLMAGRWPLAWARVDHDHRGYWYVRREIQGRSPGLVVPPLTAPEARGPSVSMGSEAWFQWWARAFARKLSDGAMSPLHAGRWWFAPPQVEAGDSDWRPVASRGTTRVPACRMDRLADQPAHGYTEWDFTDDLTPLALRSMSAVEDDRVVAWRRAFREGVLPPVLVMWVSGLDRYVVLDGHDRVVAAQAEGAMPLAMGILRILERPFQPDRERARAISEEVSTQLLAAKDPNLRGRPFTVATANRLLIEAHDSRPRQSLVTRAWPLDGGARLWCEQVRQVLATEGVAAEEPRHQMLADLEAPP